MSILKKCFSNVGLDENYCRLIVDDEMTLQVCCCQSGVISLEELVRELQSSEADLIQILMVDYGYTLEEAHFLKALRFVF